MSAFHHFLRRVCSIFRRHRLDRDMQSELEFHLNQRTEANIAEGLPPDVARHEAYRKFGGVEQIKEHVRDERGFIWFDQLSQDIRFAIRSLRRHLIFTCVAIFSLALGLGPNVVVFSLINDRLMNLLPVKKPSELVLFEWMNRPMAKGPQWTGDVGTPDKDPGTGQPLIRVFSRRIFEEFHRHGDSLQSTFACAPLSDATITIDGQSEAVGSGELVSGGYFGGLGVSAAIGRTISDDDDRLGSPPVAVLSYRYWRTRFDGNPGILGKTIEVNGHAATIIGVSQAGFDGTMLGGGLANITLPLSMASMLNKGNTGAWWLRIMGRLRPGATYWQVIADFEPLFRSTALSGEGALGIPFLRVAPAGSGWSDGDRRMFKIILFPVLGMLSLILLTACANLANLLLARGVARRAEIATRLALGASRGRIVRQLLVENLMVAVGGAGAGLLLSAWGLQLLVSLIPPAEKGLLARVNVDWRVMSATAGAAIITGLAFGLAPALRCTRLNITSEFQGGSRSSRPHAKSRLSKSLLTVQISVAVVLLTFAALFLTTLRNLEHGELGFRRSNILLFSINGSAASYRPEQLGDLSENLREQINAIPGVKSSGYSDWSFVSGNGGANSELRIPNSLLMTGKDAVTYNRISNGFFETYGIKLISGRTFNESDHPKGSKVAIVNEAFVQKYFGADVPLDKYVNFLGDRRIVGISANVKQSSLRDTTPPTIFIPSGQALGAGTMQFVVNIHTGDAGAIARMVRERIQGLNPRLSMSEVRTQEEQVNRSLTGERMISSLSSYLGVLALVLASVGLFGLVSFGVVQRQKEIGVRMALGARPRAILFMIFRESSKPLVIGLCLGLVLAFLLTKVATSLLFGVSFSDPSIYASISGLLILVVGAACAIPAWKAARVNPLAALRCE